MDLAPLEKGKREAEDAIETEAASVKKQKIEENVCEIETRTVGIENNVETSSVADEQLIKGKSGVNAHVAEVEDISNVLEEDLGAAAEKLVMVSKEGHIATAFEKDGDSDSLLQDETSLDAAVKSSASLMEEDPSDPLEKKDDWSEGPTSSAEGAAFLNENITAANLSSPAPSTKISLVSIQKRDDSMTHEFDSAHETNKVDITDTATDKDPVVSWEKKDKSFSYDERSNKVRAESNASFLTKQEDETNEKLEVDDETSSSDDDLQTPTTPTEHTSGSKTLFVGNLSFSIEQEDVEDFFKAAGEVVSIRFAMNSDETFKGYGYVDFASAEAAEKALHELNGKELLHRRVRLDSVKPRGSFTKYTGQGAASFQNGGTTQGQTVFIRGFNNADCQDEVRRSLEEHFGTCGDISRISVPKDQDGSVRGFAYIHFKDSGAFSRALALDGSEFKEGILNVKEARPTGDRRDSAGSGRGYDSNGGRFNSQGFGGRSDGSNCRGRIGWSDSRGRGRSDFCGRSGRSDFQGSSSGSDFCGRSGGSDFSGGHGGFDFRGRSGGSDFWGRGGSDFRGRSGGSDFWGRGASDFRGRNSGSDFRGRSSWSNFSGRRGGSNFQGRGCGSDFHESSGGSDFSGRHGGSDMWGRSGRSDFHGGWSGIRGRSDGSNFHGGSGWSDIRGRSDGSNFHRGSGWSDFRGRSGGSEFRGGGGSSDWRGRMGGSNFRGRSSWSDMHGRGGRSDFGGTWKQSNGRGVWRDFSGRGIMDSFDERNNVGGSGNGNGNGNGVGFEGDGIGLETPPSPAPAPAPAPSPATATAPAPSPAPSPAHSPAPSPATAPAPSPAPSTAPAPAPSSAPSPGNYATCNNEGKFEDEIK